MPGRYRSNFSNQAQAFVLQIITNLISAAALILRIDRRGRDLVQRDNPAEKKVSLKARRLDSSIPQLVKALPTGRLTVLLEHESVRK
jgi:hypothetical protein